MRSANEGGTFRVSFSCKNPSDRRNREHPINKFINESGIFSAGLRSFALKSFFVTAEFGWASEILAPFFSRALRAILVSCIHTNLGNGMGFKSPRDCASSARIIGMVSMKQ